MGKLIFPRRDEFTQYATNLPFMNSMHPSMYSIYAHLRTSTRRRRIQPFLEISNASDPIMAAARLLRLMSKSPCKEFISNPTSPALMGSRQKPVMCLISQVGLSSDAPQPMGGPGQRKPVAAQAAGCASPCVLTAESRVDSALLADIVQVMRRRWIEFFAKPRPWRSHHIQAFVEKAILDCRFFALLATAGSLIGSVLCFLEGCFLVLESYFQYFQALSQMSEQGHIILLLIEAIDMFLVGTAMLMFGMALHVMFVGTNNLRGSNLEKLLTWIRMKSVMEAKSKIGHAMILILQVEVLEKFKGIAIISGFDLACFAGVVFLCSASIFLLSRIAVSRVEG